MPASNVSSVFSFTPCKDEPFVEGPRESQPSVPERRKKWLGWTYWELTLHRAFWVVLLMSRARLAVASTCWFSVLSLHKVQPHSRAFRTLHLKWVCVQLFYNVFLFDWWFLWVLGCLPSCLQPLIWAVWYMLERSWEFESWLHSVCPGTQRLPSTTEQAFLPSYKVTVRSNSVIACACGSVSATMGASLCKIFIVVFIAHPKLVCGSLRG